MQNGQVSSRPAGSSARIDDGVVLEQLDRICVSREFHATPRMQAFLRFCVEEALAGRADQLKGYTIALQVFGRDEDFDSAQDPIVRIQAGRLRRALERYYLVAGGEDPVVIDIPKGGYVPTFTRRSAPVAQAKSVEPLTGLSVPAIAVMPLEDLAPDTTKEYFAAGLAEELVTELNRYQDIAVVPCHRASPNQGSAPDLTRMCREMGARFQLGGTVRRDATSAKISAWLVDTTDGRQVWTKAFKRSLAASDLIETQEEIAASVVAALGSEHGVIVQRLAAESRKKRPSELSTYEAMLCYHSYQIAPSPAAAGPCFEALQTAVEGEPDYGPAWSALATLFCQMYVYDAPGFENPLATGLSYAQKGVSLEPGRQLSRLILAYASLLEDALDAFEEEANTALALNPNNPYVTGSVGYLQVLAGNFEKGLELLDRAIAANPIQPRWFSHGYYFAHFHDGDYQSALDALNRGDDTEPWQPLLVAAALGKLGRPEAAEASIATLLERKPDFGSRARELLHRSVKSVDLVDDLIDGLEKAGVEIRDP